MSFLRTPRSLALLFLAWLLLPACEAAPPTSRWAVMLPGMWQNADCGFDSCGDPPSRLQWLGLVPGPNGWRLEPETLEWNETRGELVSAFPGTLAFLSHPTISAGSVSTPDMKFRGRPRSIRSSRFALRMPFAGREYDIVVAAGMAMARMGGQDAPLGQVGLGKSAEDGYWVELLWAGDLDRDGRLDFIVQVHEAATSSQTCLFLSGAALKPPELAAKVGCEAWPG